MGECVDVWDELGRNDDKVFEYYSMIRNIFPDFFVTICNFTGNHSKKKV